MRLAQALLEPETETELTATFFYYFINSAQKGLHGQLQNIGTFPWLNTLGKTNFLDLQPQARRRAQGLEIFCLPHPCQS